jgi:hypothetical protein
LVGESSKARKGTSWRQLSSLFAEVDDLWAARRVTTARPTANGIIHALRDQQPATDRRLFLLSEEFASLLHVLGQRNGQISPLLRCAWDGGDLSAHDGHRSLQATNACAAANPCPMAAASRWRSGQPWPARCAAPSTGCTANPGSSSAAPPLLESCGTIAILL